MFLMIYNDPNNTSKYQTRLFNNEITAIEAAAKIAVKEATNHLKDDLASAEVKKHYKDGKYAESLRTFNELDDLDVLYVEEIDAPTD